MNITLIFIFLTISSIAIFDVWVIIKKGKQESISAHIIRLSKQYPSIPFLLGYVMGHLTWSMSDKNWMINEVIK